MKPRLLNLLWQVPLALLLIQALLKPSLADRFGGIGLAFVVGLWTVARLLKRRLPKPRQIPGILDWSIDLPKRDRTGGPSEEDDEEALELVRIMGRIAGKSLQEMQVEERKAWGRTFEDDALAGKSKTIIATNPVTGERWNAYGRMDAVTKPSAPPPTESPH